MPQPINIYQFDEDYLNKKIATPFKHLKIFIILGLSILSLYVLNLAWHSKLGILYFIAGIIGLLAYHIYQPLIHAHRLTKRLNFILNTPMPTRLWLNQAFRDENLTLEQKQVIEAGLRDFFILHALFPKRPLAMPSHSVDKLWHAFILDTQSYQHYCKQAFGSLFHHVPDYQFSDRGRNIGLFTWQSACRLQGIRPARPHSLPRLFSTDMIVSGVTIGGTLWLSQLHQMGMLYEQWHAQTFNNQSGSSCGDSGSDNSSDNGFHSDYDDSCDVGVTSDGDCSCGGSGDSGSCGGGSDSSDSGSSDSSCGSSCGGGGD